MQKGGGGGGLARGLFVRGRGDQKGDDYSLSNFLTYVYMSGQRVGKWSDIYCVWFFRPAWNETE